ncbi:MAG: nitrate- and nitrite sensing domain-containing protein [Ignavibacteriales bacterium]|nr:nitrate- and nitrite sensing domain-containing protein [Ignavibacteriales bacterium]
MGEQIADKQRVIEREISFLDAFDRTVGAKLGTGEEWTRVRTGWMDLIADFPSMNEKQSFDSHTELIRSTLSLAVHIGDISGLTTDRHIDTVYLVDAALHELPQALEYAGQIRGIGTGALVRKRLTIHERAQLSHIDGTERVITGRGQGEPRKGLSGQAGPSQPC